MGTAIFHRLCSSQKHRPQWWQLYRADPPKSAAPKPNELNSVPHERQAGSARNGGGSRYCWCGSAPAACAAAAERFRDAGYATQTLRVVTNPFGEFLDLSTDETAVAGMQVLRGILTCEDMPQGTRVRFALGEARTMEEVRVVPALIRSEADLVIC